jgi:hypothetical protein
LEEARQIITKHFKQVHEFAYPGIPVNYPNHSVVDPEHHKGPFVSFNLMFDLPEQTELGTRDIEVTGRIDVIYYYPQGLGGQGYLEYTDALNAGLGLSEIEGIRYEASRVIPVSRLTGWAGSLNNIKFSLVAQACVA